MYDVVIAGAGPTGLMLARELRLAGAEVLLVDRLPGRTGESRAGGLHARTLELLDQRGIADDFLAAGRPIQAAHFAGLRLSLDGMPTRYPFLLQVLQDTVERLLEKHAGVPVRWDTEVVGLRQDGGHVEVDIRGAAPVRARYLVACDGGRSTVRRLAGIAFPGTPASLTALLGDVELAEPPEDNLFMARRPAGDFSVLGFEPDWYRVFTTEYGRVVDRDAPVTAADLRASLVRVAGTDFGMRNPRWISRFSDTARQADRYRAGRVLLAGDAAHIHFPAGGQGLNTGVQDAANLGWKLGAVLRGTAPESLLDTYQAERHPVAARVLDNTRAQAALGRPDPQTEALRAEMAALIDLAPVNDRLAGMVTGLDIRYPPGGTHPLVGRRLPDLDLTVDGAPTRAYRLLHDAQPVLLDLGGGVSLPGAGGARRIVAECAADRWTLPVVGDVPAPAAVLVRPDGYVSSVA